LKAYIKSNFSELFNNKLNKIIGYGSLTDGTYKLEVHIINFNHEDYFDLDIKKGDKIEIIGTIYNRYKNKNILIL